MRKKNLHIGQMIFDEMKRQNMCVDKIADIMNMCRSNLYYCLKQPDMKVGLILRFSRVLNTDFLQKIATEYGCI